MASPNIPQLTDLPKGPEYQAFAIGAMGDFVIVRLMNKDGSEAWAALDPTTAKQAGEVLARSGYAVETKDDVYGKKPVLVEQIRKRLVNTLLQNFRSKILIHDKVKDEKDIRQLAEETVELCLTEFT